MTDFSNPLFGNETPGITKTIDRYLTGSRIRDRWIGSSSRCDNATVKLSRGRKILSQFKFHREDDPFRLTSGTQPADKIHPGNDGTRNRREGPSFLTLRPRSNCHGTEHMWLEREHLAHLPFIERSWRRSFYFRSSGFLCSSNM